MLAFLFGAPALVFHSVEKLNVSFNWGHGGALAVSAIALFGLFRVRIAFALLALPFFVWAAYSVVRGFFFPPEWFNLINPIYVGKWAISIVIEYLIGAYFWKKFSGLGFLDWVLNLFGMGLVFGRKHQTAWNAFMGAYTFRHLDAAQQQRVLDRVRDILGGQFNRTIEDVLNVSGRIVFLNFLVYGLGEEGIHPSLGKESWFWIKNPFVECIGAEEVLEKQIQKIQKKHSVTLDLDFQEGA